MPESVVKIWQETLAPSNNAHITHVRINRPDQANAFNSKVMEGLTEAFQAVSKAKDCRALVVGGVGKHFSAGADLNWMKQSATLDYNENIKDAQLLTAMFEAVNSLPMPVICMTQGAVYGGAVGLTSCADIVIASDKTRFCLSEVKLGLIPAVILPYLARRMNKGFLKRAMLNAQPFDAITAQQAGLVNIVSETEAMEQHLSNELNALLANGPEAIQRLKQLYTTLEQSNFAQSVKTAEAIAAARTGDEGQQGLKAFFAKEKPEWLLTYGGE